MPNDDSRRKYKPRGRPPIYSIDEKKARKKASDLKYRRTKQGKAKANAQMRKRYRSFKDVEAANTVENMLNHARAMAFQDGYQAAIYHLKTLKVAIKHHEIMDRWSKNPPRLNAAKAEFLRDMNPLATKIRANWAKQ